MKLITKHIRWFIDHITRDRLDSTAAHSSFFLIISFLPFIAFLLTLMQHVHFSSGVTVIEALFRLIPDSVAAYIRKFFPSALETGSLISISVIMALWSSSAGMVAVIKGLDQIYEVKETRNYFYLRFMAIIYVLLFAIVILVTAALLVFGSTIYNYLLLHLSPFFANLLINFKSLVGFLLLFVFFTLMYCFLPRRRIRFVHNAVGAAFGAAGWVLFSYFFSLFVENFSNFSIYGGLATLVILMYWLFFCMYIMFLGAEVSMWLETGGFVEDVKNALKSKAKKPETVQTDSTAEDKEN